MDIDDNDNNSIESLHEEIRNLLEQNRTLRERVREIAKQKSYQDMIDFIDKYWDGDTDNSGQIIIYTSMMEDDDGNIVPWVDRFDEDTRRGPY
jgi:hypothetical protein